MSAPLPWRVFLLQVFLLGALAAPATAQSTAGSLEDRLRTVLRGPATDHASWGALVVDVESGDTLFARNERRSLIPASGLKLVTSGAALHLLGPRFRYRTELVTNAPLRDGRLEGDLWVRGSGDPTVGAEPVTDDPRSMFRGWAEALRRSGIDRVAGSVVGIDSVFDEVPYGSGWSWDDLNYYYAVPASGLSFNENCVEFDLRAGRIGEPASIAWELGRTDFVEVINATRTIPADSELVEGYDRRPGTNHFRLSSRVPAGTVDEECLAVYNPTRYFTHELRRVLVEEGIGVSGPGIDADERGAGSEGDGPYKPNDPRGLDRPRFPDGMRTLAAHTSPPLEEMVRTLNAESHNLYAEQLLKTLGVESPVPPPSTVRRGTYAAGLAAVDSFLVWTSADTSAVRIVDGSGLSRKNLITAEALVAVLRAMWTRAEAPVRSAFLGSLSEPGVRGTLEYRFRNLPPGARLRGKTGYMSGVQTLTGYVETPDGRVLAFSLLANHVTGSMDGVEHIQRRFVSALASNPDP